MGGNIQIPSLVHAELPDGKWGCGYTPKLAPSRSRLGVMRAISRVVKPPEHP
jgi:hypothetical protein